MILLEILHCEVDEVNSNKLLRTCGMDDLRLKLLKLFETMGLKASGSLLWMSACLSSSYELKINVNFYVAKTKSS